MNENTYGCVCYPGALDNSVILQYADLKVNTERVYICQYNTKMLFSNKSSQNLDFS